MAVGVVMPTRQQQVAEKDPLDTVLKGLQVAGAVFGIKDGLDKSKVLQEDLKAKTMANEQSAALTDPYSQASSDTWELNKNALKASGFSDDEIENMIPDTMTGQAINEARPIMDKMIAAKMHQQTMQNASRERAAAKEAGKAVPAGEAVQTGGATSASKALADSGILFESNSAIVGPWQGRVSGLMASGEVGDTGKRAKSFDAQLKSNAQNIGKYLEGGKLTNEDIDRYKEMLPNLRDSKESAKDKIAILQRMIATKQESELAALKGAGYNTAGIPRTNMVDLPKSLTSSMALSPPGFGGGENAVINYFKGPALSPPSANAQDKTSGQTMTFEQFMATKKRK